MSKRCLVVSYYFPPVGGGGVQRVTKLIKYLSRLSWKFTVLTSNLEDSSNISQDDTLVNDIPNSIKIIRLSKRLVTQQKFLLGKILATFKASFFIRWISSLIFIPDIHKKWSLHAEKKIYELLKKEKFDLVFITAPPYSLTCLASRLTKLIDIPVVVDLRDPWTTNPYKIYPSSWHLKREKKLEKNSISSIKFGISAYKSLIDLYEKLGYITDKDNWGYIPNGFDENDFKIIPRKQKEDFLNIAFSGTFYSHVNNPKVVFKAISKLPLELQKRINFHHIGDSNINLKKVAAKYNLTSQLIEWGYKNHKECLEILSGMDILCFILDSPNPNAQNTIGGKVYEYLRLGKPILALVPENGEAAQLITETSSGKVINPINEKNIVKTLQDWLNDKPVLSRKIALDTFERRNLAQKYATFFEKVCSK